MELTIDQALQQGIAAHREGNLQDAERLYRAILKAQPGHPDANHNLGVLAVSVGKSLDALPLFKLALESNPKIEQFWLSYIDALIKTEKVEKARKVLADAALAGVTEEKLNVYERWQENPLRQTRGREGLKLSDKRRGLAAKKKRKRIAQQALLATEPSQNQLDRLLEHYQSDNFEQAEELATAMTEEFPDHDFGWKVLGAVLKHAGKLSESLVAMQRAVTLAPEVAETHNNLGAVLIGLGRLDEAAACLRRAMELDPDHAEAHYNSGNIAKKLGKFELAEVDFKKAIGLQPSFAEAYLNLGIVMREMGRLDDAIPATAKAIILKPTLSAAKVEFGSILRTARFQSSERWLYPPLVELLTVGNLVRPRDISGAILSLLKQDPLVQDHLFKENIHNDLSAVTSAIKALEELPLLHNLMRICPLADLEFERVFVAMRGVLLENREVVESTPELVNFLSTLALQCFTNEYVYFESDKESRLIAELEVKISKAVALSEQPNILDTLCFASYRQLHRYAWAEALDVLNQHKDVKTRLIDEPRSERQLAKDIPLLVEISDSVSCKVKDQYEESPYPRWVKTAIHPETVSIGRMCDELKLRLQSSDIRQVCAPKVLVAGCGTGQHPISVASRFTDCQVTAVDLSLASLGYAQRKTREHGMKNLEYLQADILDLHRLDRQFDVIESAGVLHHMDDPIAGWRVITDLLTPGGLMKIGLYSELARRHIIKTREEIASLGIGTSESDIRNFRWSLINSEAEHHRWLLKLRDFFSLSEIRDLIFHVQEHRYTLPEIRACLDELGLHFCGFEAGAIVSKFRQSYGKAEDIYDLALWARFEEDNPLTFSGMYQFWCQKL